MNKTQIAVIAAAVAVFATLYFGCDTQSKEQAVAEKSRNLQGVQLDPATLVENAFEETKTHVSETQFAEIQMVTENLGGVKASVANAATAENTANLKKLSAAWHQAEHDEIAGIYAEKIAEIEKTDEAWSIAGSSYFLALQKIEDKSLRDFCSRKALDAFQNAASLNPKKLDHQINMGLTYAENPPADNPMKGILLLVELEKANVGNVPLNIQLARLAMKTNQYDRAIVRLEKVLPSEPQNPRIICLLADAYTQASNPKATEFAQKCRAKMK
jgi:predicted Zn-dependent protease